MKRTEVASAIKNKESRCMVLQQDGKVLNYSNVGGIFAAKDLYQNYKNELKDSFVAINLLSRATAAILIEVEVSSVYAHKLSKHAIGLLEDYHIDYSYGEIVEYISNGARTGMCPYETMALDNKDAGGIVQALLAVFQD